jgi:ATP-binding cassette subfamily B protein
MTDKTVVVVTHRSAALDACDRILEFTESGVVCRDR